MEIGGKVDTPAYKKLKAKLEDNLYYQLDKQCMAATVMSNVLDTPNIPTRFTDKAVRLGMKNMFGSMGTKTFETMQTVYLSPQAKTGQYAMKLFGNIDAMSRYSLIKAHMDNGMSMKDAIAKSNSIYGDLDIIAPRWSQAIQQYGAIPFSNWFFRVSGGIGDSTKQNIGKAVGLYAALEGVGYLSDTRTDSMNPMKTLLDSPVDMINMSPYNNPLNFIKSAMSPAIYSKSMRAIEYNDPKSVILTDNF